MLPVIPSSAMKTWLFGIVQKIDMYLKCKHGRTICVSIYLSLYLSIYLPIYRSIYLSAYQPTYLSIDLSIYLSTYLPTSLSIYLSTYQPTYLSIDLSIYLLLNLPTYLPTYLSIDLSVCLSNHLIVYLSFSLFFLLAQNYEAYCGIVDPTIIPAASRCDVLVIQGRDRARALEWRYESISDETGNIGTPWMWIVFMNIKRGVDVAVSDYEW